MKHIYFREGFKYQLTKDYWASTGIIPPVDTIYTRFITLHKSGRLTVGSAYAWDGPSGPTIDTLNSMRSSLEHDALYQLMRMNLLPPEYRLKADERMRVVCLEDGMSEFRADYWYRSLRAWGDDAADPSNRKEVIVAPPVPHKLVEEDKEEEW